MVQHLRSMAEQL